MNTNIDRISASPSPLPFHLAHYAKYLNVLLETCLMMWFNFYRNGGLL